jgi:hypothetical protein
MGYGRIDCDVITSASCNEPSECLSILIERLNRSTEKDPYRGLELILSYVFHRSISQDGRFSNYWGNSAGRHSWLGNFSMLQIRRTFGEVGRPWPNSTNRHSNNERMKSAITPIAEIFLWRRRFPCLYSTKPCSVRTGRILVDGGTDGEVLSETG